MVFLFSIFTYEFVNKKKFFVKSKTLVFSYIKASVVALILLFPFLIKFGQYFPISFSKDNVVDLMTFAHDREVMSIDEKLWNILFVPHIGLMYSSLFVIGIVSFVLSLKKFIKDKKIILVYFFIFLILQNFIIFNNLNLSRAVSFSWLVYPITFSFYLTNPFLNIVILPIFYFFESPSPLYLIKILTPIEQPGIVPWVVWSGYNEAIAFIRENTMIDSIFLIDGGGSGCTGASSDYGERIFPLTSRRIFYFTDYCWANYDKSEYRKRVEIYRKISINPDDHEALADLKGYNVTHVFIGPNDVGLNSKLFLNSSNYELIYDENKFQIFKIK